MKVIRRSLKHWLKPTDWWYIRWLVTQRGRLEQFRDKHKGEDCFIIGNGPSLTKTDLVRLADYHTFGLNKIYLMFDTVDLNLSYHVAVNPLVIEQSIAEFEAMKCPTFLSYRAAEDRLKPLEHIYYILTKGGMCGFQTDFSGPICEGCTVTYVALQLAYIMGFTRVFLIGVDHSFAAVGNPHERQHMTNDDPNHFDPRYFKDNDWHLPDLVCSEVMYHTAKYQYERYGREVFDATVEGKLQVFKKISYEEALEKARKR